MSRRRFKVPILLLWAAAALSLVMHQGVCLAAGGGNGKGKGVTQDQVMKNFNKVAPSEQKAAAKRAQELGLKPGVAGAALAAPVAAALPLPGLDGPGGVPHYFGPYGNWAYSPLPKGGVATLTVTAGGTGYGNPVVTIGDAYGTGSGATATATVGAGGVIAGLTVTASGTGYSAPVVTITDGLVPGPGTGATATATLAPSSVAAITGGGGSGYTSPLVTITDNPALCGGAGQPLCGTGASATATVDALGAVNGFTMVSGGSGYTAPLVAIADDPTLCGGVAQPACGAGATAAATLAPSPLASIAVVLGGVGYTAPVITIADTTGTGASATATVVGGIITAITVNAGGTGYTAPAVSIADTPVPGLGTGATADAVIGGVLTGGMAKFVDLLPGIPGVTSYNTVANGYNADGSNNLGQSVPFAVKDTTTYPGSDYYEIALVEFSEKMHTALQPTRLRGYVQIEPPGSLTTPPGSKHVLLPGVTYNGFPIYGYDQPRYLGPTIVASGSTHGIQTVLADPGDPVPVRIKFYNLLPAGAGGDLFIPVDKTVPGSGVGPSLPGTAGDMFTQNRATIHLHGNNTVWLSDGNVHQWITPANEVTPYPAGVSARNVPDMGSACDADPLNAPGVPGKSGCMTFFYTNAQSARLQFYHDHSLGITRLNVYAGEAAGYVITNAVEQDMINGTNVSGVNPGLLKVLPDIGIPLVIQDRTWVEAATIFAQDPTWNAGTGPRDPTTGNITGAVDGDFWYPHVYMSAQNPWDLTGTNAFGRWHYGPWFNPPVPECVNGLPVGCIEVGPVPNEYYDPVNAPWEPPMRPGVPNPSIAGEGFMDTPTVNGTAYPVLKVEPKAYRFRVLSAANDRMFNLQLYVAADKTTWVPSAAPGIPGSPTVLCAPTPVDPSVCTEVKMVSVAGAPNQYADWPSGIPDPLTAGPPWIMIGTEGGFMPKPVMVSQQPVGWNLNPTTFNFGNVNQHSLLVGSAERADVVVDFSAYAGKTLILYNDAPAAFPAGVPVYDYFTGVANQMDVGGAPTTQPGYGPNTRTIMQIQVGTTVTTPTPQVTLANLEAVFAKTATKRGVFEVSQEPIIIPQAEYNSAYNNTFPSTAAEQFIQIADAAKTFKPIDETGTIAQNPVTMPLEMKAMHDEMGGVYDTQFGRMSGMLGLTNPTSPVHVLIPYGLASPPTDLVQGSVEGSPIGVMPDGTQIWRIFHNGVDTHTIHTHLFHAQLINRLGQDGILLPTDPIELGWKDTFRVNPLEITYLAMRPTVPTPAQVPFPVPDSVRLIDPTLPEGATLIPPAPAGWFDPAGNAITEILNHYVNFGWEYVWHCHILAHEEMDMMHSLVFAVPPTASTGLTAAWNGSTGGNRSVTLIWTDNSTKETGFTIQRATDANFTAGLTSFNVAASALPVPSNVSYVDTTVAANVRYWYRVVAVGSPVGDIATAGFPTMSADSVSNTVSVLVGIAPAPPAAPTNLTRTVQAGPRVSLTWRDNATNETGFVVERCTVVAPATACTNFAQIAAPGPRNNTGNVTYVDATVTAGNTYDYQVKAVNAGGASAPSNVVAAVVPAVPAAPSNFRVAAAKANGNNYTATLTWTDNANNETGFTIQRANNLDFTTGLASFNLAANTATLVQTVTKNTVYYYRIRANNLGGSSAWTNALPFPIRTGP